MLTRNTQSLLCTWKRRLECGWMKAGQKMFVVVLHGPSVISFMVRSASRSTTAYISVFEYVRSLPNSSESATVRWVVLVVVGVVAGDDRPIKKSILANPRTRLQKGAMVVGMAMCVVASCWFVSRPLWPHSLARGSGSLRPLCVESWLHSLCGSAVVVRRSTASIGRMVIDRPRRDTLRSRKNTYYRSISC